MNKLKNILVGVIAITMTSFSSAYSFEGFSVGAVYSQMDFSTKGKEVTSTGTLTEALEANSTTKTGSGDLGSVFAEYTFAQGSTLGVEMIQGSATLGKATRTGTSIGDVLTAYTVTASAEISDPTTFYVEPTFMLNEKFGVYVKGGATTVSVTPKEVDANSATSSTYKAQDVWGIMTGFGAKYYIGNFFAKAEYVETEFATYNHQSTTGNKHIITADIDTEETRFAVGYNF